MIRPRPKFSVIRELAIQKLENAFQDKIIEAQMLLSRALGAHFTSEMKTKDGELTSSSKNFSIVDNIENSEAYKDWLNLYGQDLLNWLANSLIEIHQANESFFKDAAGKDISGISDEVLTTMIKKLGPTWGFVKSDITKKIGVNLLKLAGDPLEKVKAEVLRAIVSGQSLAELKNSMDAMGRSTSGPLADYFNRIAYDLYQQYDRETARQFALRLDLRYAIYQGGIIKTTRLFCELRNDQVFTIDEIKKFGTKHDRWGGYTNKELGEFQGKSEPYNPMLDLGGYNCRHFLDWISSELGEYLKTLQDDPEGPEDLENKINKLLDEKDTPEGRKAALDWYTEKLKEVAKNNPDGFTISLQNMKFTTDGTVSAYLDTQNSFNDQGLRAVIDHALDHDMLVGGWYDSQGGKYYYDSVKVYLNKDKAIEFGFKQKQIAIFDIGNLEEIRLVPDNFDMSDQDKVNAWFSNIDNLKKLGIDVTSPLYRAVHQVESEIVNRKTERGVLFNRKGDYVGSWTGTRNRINLEGIQNLPTNGNVFTHNHPSWSSDPRGFGNSFSSTDIMTSFNLGLGEIRAVTGRKAYILKIEPKFRIGKLFGGRKVSRGLLTDQDLRAIKRRIRNFNRKVENELWEKIRSKETTTDEANWLHADKLWTYFFEDTEGLTYEAKDR